MKKKGALFITLLILAIVFFTVNVVFDSLTGSKLVDFERFNLVEKVAKTVSEDKKSEILSTKNCSVIDKIDLSQAQDEHLLALSRYQEYCGSLATDHLMIFIDMPKDSQVAKDDADKVADILIEFDSYGVTPLVIVEPVSDWGLIDFNEFRTGFYDSWIESFFKELKQRGITDEQMGIWIPFPEANLPLWNHTNATADDYSFVVNKYLRILKKYYPNAETSILLNSATYENDDFDWLNGEYVSLLPYVKNIENGLVDSFGLQGLPWVSRSGEQSGSVFNADEFLNPRIAVEAARELGVTKIWLNTGTFGAKYTIDPESTVYITTERRKDILNGILSAAIDIKDEGFDVTINLFSEDKSGLTEATDWSYLPNSYSKDEAAISIFKEFAAKVEENNMTLSIFDKEK